MTTDVESERAVCLRLRRPDLPDHLGAPIRESGRFWRRQADEVELRELGEKSEMLHGLHAAQILGRVGSAELQGREEAIDLAGRERALARYRRGEEVLLSLRI